MEMVTIETMETMETMLVAKDDSGVGNNDGVIILAMIMMVETDDEGDKSDSGAHGQDDDRTEDDHGEDDVDEEDKNGCGGDNNSMITLVTKLMVETMLMEVTRGGRNSVDRGNKNDRHGNSTEWSHISIHREPWYQKAYHCPPQQQPAISVSTVLPTTTTVWP